MQNIKEKVRFTLSALLYFMFTLRIGADLQATVEATAWQFLQTPAAPLLFPLPPGQLLKSQTGASP